MHLGYRKGLSFEAFRQRVKKMTFVFFANGRTYRADIPLTLYNLPTFNIKVMDDIPDGKLRDDEMGKTWAV